MSNETSIVLVTLISAISPILIAVTAYVQMRGASARETRAAKRMEEAEERIRKETLAAAEKAATKLEQARLEAIAAAEKLAGAVSKSNADTALALDETRKAAVSSAESADKIHTAVNSERTAMLKHVEDLKNEITALLVQAAKKDAAAAAAAPAP